MLSKDPSIPRPTIQVGRAGGPSPIAWGDELWDPIVGPVLDGLQDSLKKKCRAGELFALLARLWKSGGTVPSNSELTDTLGWEKEGHVVEGYRAIRRRLRTLEDSPVRVELPSNARGLTVLPRLTIRPGGDVLLSVPRERETVAGAALRGADGVLQPRKMTVQCRVSQSAKEQARQLTAGSYSGYMILPANETGDYGIYEKLAESGIPTVLLDVKPPECALPCATFDYAGIGLYCTGKLLSMGCRDVLLLTCGHDSRTEAIGKGYRRAMRQRDLAPRDPFTLYGTDISAVRSAVERLEQMKLWTPKQSRLGLLCADGATGEALVRYLSGIEPGGWDIAVAVAGGTRWAGPHWAELIWAELDFANLAAVATQYLLGAMEAPLPWVAPKYHTQPRKPPASAEWPEWQELAAEA